MARTLTYNINRFDQGMSGDIRDTSNPLKFAFIQHLDIYRNPSEAYVLPGYVADQAFDGNANGLKTYRVRAINYMDGKVIGVGRKADNTGSKLFYKDTAEGSTWLNGISGSSIEGTDNLAPNTWLAGDVNNTFFITEAGGTTYVSRQNVGTITDKYATILATTGINKDLVVERSFLDSSIQYVNKGGLASGISSIDGSTFTVTAKSTAGGASDIQSGNDTIGLGVSINFPSRAQILQWDSASLLIDQKVNLNGGRMKAVGYPSGLWYGVVNEGLDASVGGLNEQANNEPSFSIKAVSGATTETIYRTTAPTSTNGDIMPVRGLLRDASLFYARVPKDTTPTAYYEGLWAVGKATMNSPLAISIPFDTSSLGAIASICNFGNHYYFVHSGDFSVSRLDSFETGTYDVPATLETLFYGADTPNLKGLKGLSILTENLPPSAASVEVQYRTDEDNTWTSLGTSSLAGKQKHDFTRAAGVPIGRFKEIQFKIILTGKVVIKGIRIAIEETDSLSY